MHRKGLAIGILILMLGVNIGSTFAGDVDVKSISSVGFDGNTLYVGGSGPNNYTTIQSAIDDAADGDTVFVYDNSSPYYENLIIDKSISLIGEDRNSTIIDGRNSGDTVYVIADGVNINRFTIQNCSHDSHIAGVKIVSDHNSIKDNRIAQNNGLGILLNHSSYNIIQNNIMINNLNYIRLEGSSHNTIQYNKLDQSDDWHFYLDGISLSESSNNLIYNNELRNLHLFVGIGGWKLSNNNTIQENTILNNKSSHLPTNLIQLEDSHNNSVINNIVKDNNGSGISLFSSINNKIVGNVIESVGNSGIGVVACKDTVIKNNNISSNRVGISIGIQSFLNTVESNNIINNDIGVKLKDFRIDPHIIGDCILNIIRFNNFIGNERMAYDDNLFALNTWYRNYWNRPRIFPKLIFGIRTIGDNMKIPVIHFDLRPASEPHDIGVL